jgi:hypothetical protein
MKAGGDCPAGRIWAGHGRLCLRQPDLVAGRCLQSPGCCLLAGDCLGLVVGCWLPIYALAYG